MFLSKVRCVAPIFCLAVVFGSVQAAMAQENAIRVGPNVQVSAKHSDRAHWEIRMAADPENPGHLMACSFIHSGAQNSFHTVVYVSSDAGKSWTPTLESDRTGFVGDPECVYGLNGTAYFVTLALHYESSADPETLVYRSTDGGYKWEQPISFLFIDREYLAVDRTQGKYRGRLYLNGNASKHPSVDNPKASYNMFNLFRSFDAGVSFQPPVYVLTDPPHAHMPMGNGEVFSDGAYIVGFPELNGQYDADKKPTSAIKFLRSEDGGESFDKADVLVSGLPSISFPMIAVDHSDGPFKDRLYAVWTSDPRGSWASGHMNIQFAYSKDKGKTWSPAKPVNDEPDRDAPDRTGDHFMPVVTVNTQGVVGVEWYDRRDHQKDTGWTPRFAASVDGGETFLPSVKISEAPMQHKPGETEPIFIYDEGGGALRESHRSPIFKMHVQMDQGEEGGGDTGGIAADTDGVFHPLWVDNRTGVLQLWSTAVTVSGKAYPNGSEELASFTDVTGKVAVEYSNTNYDPRSGNISFDATLINTSKDQISGPIKLRLIDLDAGTGTAQVVNADNHMNRPGAVWDLTGSAPNGLKPGDKSGKKRLEFHLTGMRPFAREGERRASPDLITVEAKVLAKESGKQ
jgi:hypothetical protein